MAWVLDLSKSRLEYALEHGRVLGAQLKPGTEPRQLVIRCFVEEPMLRCPPLGKLTTSIGR